MFGCKALRLIAALLLVALAQAAAARPVLLISIDGLRPAALFAPDSAAPTLRALAMRGARSEAVLGTWPTLTYPAHTTLITGASPARHGIGANEAFDPLQANAEGWMWYASDITADTLWQAAHRAGLRTAAINWPVTVGAAIDWNVPQYWRAGSADDMKLLTALSTPGLAHWLEQRTGLALPNPRDSAPSADHARTVHAAALIVGHHPDLLALHLDSLDHASHDFGPDSPEARSVLGSLDRIVAELVASTRKAAPQTAILIVSDHGFVAVDHFINLPFALREAGLVPAEGWRVAVWPMSGSAAIVLHDDQDHAAREATAAVLRRLAADPANGIARVLDADAIAAGGGSPLAAFWVDFQPGVTAGGYASGPLRQEAWLKGSHGHLPDAPGMEAVFFAVGPGIAPGCNLGMIDMRQVGPTIAALLRVRLRDASQPKLPIER